MQVEALVEREAETWLDGIDSQDIEAWRGDFAREVRSAVQARSAWLGREGHEFGPDGRLSGDAIVRLRRVEMEKMIAAEETRQGKAFVPLGSQRGFQGVYTRNVDLAQGRFAVVEGTDGFALAAWSKRNALWRGKELVLERSGSSVQWRLAKGRTIIL